MENFRNRLNFANISVKTRILSKVVENVSSRIIDQLIPDQTPELSLLWEKCNDESPITSKLCCQTIVSLVSQKRLNSLNLVDEFLALVTSFRHMGIFVQTVTDLLLLNLNEQLEHNSKYCCPYSVSTPIHPFIVILRERAESWPVVYQCIHSVIIQQELHSGLQIMKPAIRYVLLEPYSSDSSSLRTLMYNDLLSFEEGRKFIITCLPLLQLKSLVELMEAVFVIQRLCVIINEKTNTADIETLLLTSLSLCQTSAIHGFPCSSLILVCKEIFNFQEISSLSTCICIAILSELITDAVGTELYHLLCLGEILLKQRGIAKSVSSILILPLLSVVCGEHDNNIKNTAAKVIVAIEEYDNFCKASEQIWPENEFKEYFLIGFHPISSQAMQYVIMLSSFEKMKDESAKEKWLESVLSFIKLKTDIPSLLIDVVASILINSHNMIIYKKCLLALELIATVQPEQGMSFFPILLYKFRFETDPDLELIILESLPNVATHTYSVGAILNTIHLLARYPKLKPQAIYLMMLLWKKQERCFPYLKRMLEVDSDTTGSFNEVLTSQASAMKNICDIRPQLDGIDILANISKIFNTCSSDASSPAVVLALQGVSSLCKAETIDLRTAWKALARKLANDKRPLVLKHLFGLLSLAPELKTLSPHYEKFMTTAAEMLWKHIRMQSNPLTIGAAYAALGQYPPEYHQLKVLPDIAKAKIVPPRVSTPLDLSKNIEELLGYTPGYCFVHLLESIDDNDIRRGYEEFLTGLLKYETNNMPKNIYHTGKIAIKQTKHDRLFSSVPEFLCVRYNDNRQPGMQGNLAFGVLLSYHPPIEVGRDGQPTKKSILSQAEYYRQILEPLLQDVTIDTSDWYQCILLSYSWCEFMDHAFISCLESEYAQKEIESQHAGNQTDTTEQVNISLYIQDCLLKIIQKQSKGKPTSQANALLAVVGLTVSVCKYESTLNQTGTVISDNHACYNLMLTTLETLLCALEPSRKSSFQIFSWLIAGQRGGVTSLILKGYIALSFFHLVPFLIHSFSEQITVICKLLLHQIITKSGSILQLHCGIGIGLFLQAICREQHQADIVANVSVSDITKQLESLCTKDEDEIQLGPFLGLSLAGISLCEDAAESSQERGKQIQAFCVHLLKKIDPLSVSYDVLAQCTSVITAFAQANNLLASNEYKEILELFDTYRNDRPQCSGSAAAVGTMIGLLHNSGYSSSSEEKNSLFQTWKSIVLSENMPILHRLAALKGLGSLYGTYNCIHSLNNKNTDFTDLHEVIQVAMKLFQTRDVTLKNMAVCLLGEISRIPRGSDTPSFPTSYFYLDDKYVLKYILDFVIQHAKTNSTEVYDNLLLCLCLLGKEYPKPFPPISWPTVLTPFLQRDKEIIEACLKILVSQCASSPSASSFLGTLIRMPQIVSSFRRFLLSSLPSLFKSLSTVNVRYFVSAIILPSLCAPNGIHKYGKIVLEAMLKCLSFPELSLATNETLKTLIANVVDTCFAKNVAYFQELKLTSILCNCLVQLPVDTLRKLCDETNTDLVPAFILRCDLIRVGIFPLNYINTSLDMAALSNEDTQKAVMQILLQLFGTYVDTNINTEKLKVASTWLLELMGQIKSKLLHKSIHDSKEIDFFLYVYITATVGFSGAHLACVVQANIGMLNIDCSLLPTLSSILPLLLDKEPWSQLTDKMLDWLLFLMTSNGVSEPLKKSIFAALCSLRGYKKFAKHSIYSQVLCNLQS